MLCICYTYTYNDFHLISYIMSSSVRDVLVFPGQRTTIFMLGISMFNGEKRPVITVDERSTL